MLHSENPLRPVPAIMLPRKPPRNAPTIPMMIVMKTPPGSLPGMMALAIAPAIKPRTIHARIDISSKPPIGGRDSPGEAQRAYQLGSQESDSHVSFSSPSAAASIG